MGARGGKERGAHGLPLEGLGTRGRGRRGRLDGAERPAAKSRDDSGAPAAVGGGEQVGELHGALEKVVAGSIWLGEGRRRALRGSRRPASTLSAATAHQR